MENLKKYFAFSLLLVFLGSCQDVVDVDLEQGTPQLVVDAWLNDLDVTQKIRLRTTSPFFDNSPAPAVRGAIVTVVDNNGTSFLFQDINDNGEYTWEPTGGQTFGTIGNSYTLNVEFNGKTYTANSSMNRVPPVDSITWEFEEARIGFPEGIYAEFFARDPAGIGDCYWIKTFKNGQFLNKPQELNIAFDAGFDQGAEVDGLIFIPPIRFTINRVPDTGDDAVDTDDLPPYAIGDSIYVEIHSITQDAFFYWEQARIQMTLGDATIFAEPPSNVPTNISSSDASERPQGFFNVSAVSGLGVRVTE